MIAECAGLASCCFNATSGVDDGVGSLSSTAPTPRGLRRGRALSPSPGRKPSWREAPFQDELGRLG